MGTLNYTFEMLGPSLALMMTVLRGSGLYVTVPLSFRGLNLHYFYVQPAAISFFSFITIYEQTFENSAK